MSVFDKLDRAIAEVIEAQGNKVEAGKEGIRVRGLVIEKVRQAAAVAHEDGIESETAAERMRVFMEASKLKPGTVRPYVAATRGYVEALNDGKDIEAFKVKANGETAPMTVAEAQRYIEERSLTDEEKQQRQANADLLAELVKRAKAAIADGDRDSVENAIAELPEVPDERAMSREEKRIAEAKARLAEMDREAERAAQQQDRRAA